MQDTLTFEELIGMRNALMVNQQRIYITAISNINMRYSELLKNDFGSTLVRNCAWDIADTLVTEYFDTGDFYISPQQVYDRIVHFSYDDKSDPFLHNDAIRKALKQINEIDKKRKEYYQYYTGNEWGKPKNYDICLNSGNLGIEACVEIIANLITKGDFQL